MKRLSSEEFWTINQRVSLKHDDKERKYTQLPTAEVKYRYCELIDRQWTDKKEVVIHRNLVTNSSEKCFDHVIGVFRKTLTLVDIEAFLNRHPEAAYGKLHYMFYFSRKGYKFTLLLIRRKEGINGIYLTQFKED